MKAAQGDRSEAGTGRAPYVMVGLGEILWDLLPAGRQLGGAPANFAYHAHALGAEAYVVSAVGDDDLGREITDRLRSLNLDTRFLGVCREHPTGTVEVQLDGRGQPRFIIHENVAWDHIPPGPELDALAARTDAVCFGSLCQRSPVSRGTIRRFLGATRPGCLRVFDINLRQHYYNEGVVRDLLRLSNVLKLNDEELPVVARLLSIDGSEGECLARLIESYGLRLVVLTRGSRGSVLRSPSEVSSHPGRQVKVVDTVGAGDAFTAATVVGFLRGLELDHINAVANRVAAHVCSHAGATPAIPETLKDALDDARA